DSEARRAKFRFEERSFIAVGRLPDNFFDESGFVAVEWDWHEQFGVAARLANQRLAPTGHLEMELQFAVGQIGISALFFDFLANPRPEPKILRWLFAADRELASKEWINFA